jgi:hypothetical protein
MIGSRICPGNFRPILYPTGWQTNEGREGYVFRITLCHEREACMQYCYNITTLISLAAGQAQRHQNLPSTKVWPSSSNVQRKSLERSHQKINPYILLGSEMISLRATVHPRLSPQIIPKY